MAGGTSDFQSLQTGVGWGEGTEVDLRGQKCILGFGAREFAAVENSLLMVLLGTDTETLRGVSLSLSDVY